MITYRPDIDGLRAVAVLAVMFSHFGIPGFSGGYVGVDIFFVISGFLISSILLNEMEQGQFSLLGFYERRARRILPALFAVISACFVAGWFLFPPPQYEEMAWSALATILFVSNIWFQRNAGDYFADPAESEPLLHTWSLGVEEQFYIVTPLLMLLLFPLGIKRLRLAVLLGIALSLGLSIYSTNNDPTANFYSLPTRAWEIGLGVMLAVWRPNFAGSQVSAEVVSALGLAAILIAIGCYDSQTKFPGFAALLPTLGAVAIIAAGHGKRTVVARFLSTGPMVGIGLMSYSLYLWHWPASVLARQYSGGIEIAFGPAVAAIVFSTIAAAVSWRYIEKPFRIGGDGRLGRPQIFKLSLIAGMMIASLSIGVGRAEGCWARSPELHVSYAQARSKFSDRHGCIRDPVSGGCRLGDLSSENTTSVVLWGDSHARSLSPGLNAVLQRENEAGEVITKVGCAPVANADLFGLDKCTEFNQSVLDYIIGAPGIETIILHARWPMWSLGQPMSGEHAGATYQVPLGVTKAEYRARRAKLLEDGLERVVAELTTAQRNVIIVSGVPEMDIDVPRNELSAAYLGIAPVIGKPLADIRVRQAIADDILQRIASKHDATFIDVPNLMCGRICPVKNSDGLLYRDNNHLSQVGATIFAERGLSELVKN